MGRKKKEKKEESEKLPSGKSILHSEAKRGILAVFLFAFSVVALLAYFEGAGLIGHWINLGLGVTVGVGKWLLPILFILAGVLLLQKREPGISDLVKYVGLFGVFLAFLGLLHLYSADTAKGLLTVAKAGRGGGFVGYALAIILLKLTGKVAGTILLVAVFIAGGIATFNVSLSEAIARGLSLFKEREAPEAGDDFENEFAEEELGGSEEEAANLYTDEPSDELKDHNIKTLSFGDDDPGEEEAVDEYPDESEDSDEPQRRRRRRKVRWELPKTNLLEGGVESAQGGDTVQNQQIVQDTLRHFGIEVEPVDVKVGPTVTQYSFRPGAGVKVSRITTLSNDLALALAAQSIRIEAPIPGQPVIGIEIPNATKARVRLRSLLDTKFFRQKKSPLMLALGHDVAGQAALADLRAMPHLLIAGRTGSGKSVCINSLLLSLLYQNTPDELQLILVDPKRVELSAYKGIPHLKTDVIVDNKKVINVLKWAVSEMERRYKLLEAAHVRDLASYQEKYRAGEKKLITDPETGKTREEDMDQLPYIVVVIDEMADLMIAHGKEVESLVIRLAQMSRAVGLHLILATQRPSVEVLTGLIKANIPTRIAFQVQSQIDSRTILDASGAEKLLGSGDMLYAASEGKETKRIQGAYISDEEVRKVAGFWKKQKEEFGIDDELDDELEGDNSIREALDSIDEGSKEDDLYEQAKQVMIDTGRPSTTYLQTALGIGYPRAARLSALLEKNGVIGLVDGKKVVLAARVAPDAEDDEAATEDPLAEQTERDKWQI